MSLRFVLDEILIKSQVKTRIQALQIDRWQYTINRQLTVTFQKKVDSTLSIESWQYTFNRNVNKTLSIEIYNTISIESLL